MEWKSLMMKRTIFVIIIMQGCFVFGPYDTMVLSVTDLIRHRLSGYSVVGDSHVKAECRLFKMVHKYAAEHHILICDSYVKSDSAHVCHREFQQKFPGDDICVRSTIHYLVKFETTGLILNKKIKRRHHVFTKEKLDHIGARLEHSPRKSLAKLAQQADISVSSAMTATKVLKLCP
jgi:hypothetical protein